MALLSEPIVNNIMDLYLGVTKNIMGTWVTKLITSEQEGKSRVRLAKNLFIARDIYSKNIKYFFVLLNVTGNTKKHFPEKNVQVKKTMLGRVMGLVILFCTNGSGGGKVKQKNVLSAVQSKGYNGQIKVMNTKEILMTGLSCARSATSSLTVKILGERPPGNMAYTA